MVNKLTWFEEKVNQDLVQMYTQRMVVPERVCICPRDLGELMHDLQSRYHAMRPVSAEFMRGWDKGVVGKFAAVTGVLDVVADSSLEPGEIAYEVRDWRRFSWPTT